MKLRHILPYHLLKNAENRPVLLDQEITKICLDSRQVEPGSLFLAMPGAVQDGTYYCADALKAGAVAIVGPENYETQNEAIKEIYIPSAQPLYDRALIAGQYYGAAPNHIMAVTGTNGKTSTAWFCYQIWDKLGVSSAFLGTLGFYSRHKHIPGKLTTPDPLTLHDLLSQAKKSGVEYVALEASSHGLDQYRLHGIPITYGVFTNLTPDHLDYHGTMDLYFQAKQKLFTDFSHSMQAVWINADDPTEAALVALASEYKIESHLFGRKANDLKLKDSHFGAAGMSISFAYQDKNYEISLPCFGDFQAYNLLAAIGMCMSSGFKLEDILAIIPKIEPVPGRMEFIPSWNGSKIIVDYAHAGDALAEVLKEARGFTSGRLCVLFGCGGDRDPNRRIQMGKVAHQMADLVYVTDDNPRSEDPHLIRQMILAECPEGIEIENRYTAIQRAIENLLPEDTLVIAGKGHEQGQILKDETLPFDDRIVAREIITNLQKNRKEAKW